MNIDTKKALLKVVSQKIQTLEKEVRELRVVKRELIKEIDKEEEENCEEDSAE